MYLCYDLPASKLLHLPMPGAALQQPPPIMACMEAAWRVWYINRWKPSQNKGATDDELQYMQWVLDDDDNARRSNQNPV